MNAIVTGATKGIGLAIAEALAAKGYNLAICSRSADDLEKTRNQLKSINSDIDIISLEVDFGQKDDVIKFADYITAKWTQIDVLVNNAGIYLGGEILSEEEGSLEQMMNVNLYSVYHLTRRLINLIPVNGHIFNMCSIASFFAYPNGGSYSISKFALLGFSKVLREELKPKGIKVTSIMPGATWSNSWAGVDLPESRLMQASDIAKVITAALEMSNSAVIEDIVLRPQLGDL